MIYESLPVNIACGLMIAAAVCLGIIGLPIYFAVCARIVYAERT